MLKNPLRHLLSVCLIFLFLSLPDKTLATDNSFITVVNPVRTLPFIKHVKESLEAEYSLIKQRNFPATWLLTYNALTDNEILHITRSMDNKQEFGIFLEVTPELAKAAGVSYNKMDSWHRAASVFLSGYTQEDRKKLIDTVLREFKQKFGYFPKSVGSWWTDSYSLEYLSKKYNVVTNLSVSDQFSLDEYKVWGTYWSTPYYPSKIHAGAPAQSENEKINIVMLRWAARDPLNGYISPSRTLASLYSTQDYPQAGLNDEYFEKLTAFYSTKASYNEFGHLAIGLESDLHPSIFGEPYATRLDKISKLRETGIKIVTMSQFSDWYQTSFPRISPPHLLISDDFIGSGKKSIWYQNPYYRIGLVYDPSDKKTKIIDLRAYFKNFQEPFYSSPNRQIGLHISLSFVIDSVIKPESQWEIECGEFLSNVKKKERDSLMFERCEILFAEKSIEIQGNILVPEFIRANKTLKIEKINGSLKIYPRQNWTLSPPGIIFEAKSVNLPFGIKRRIPRPLADGLSFLVRKVFGIFRHAEKMFVSQAEYDALMFLKGLPSGTVLVYDKDCFRCKWNSPQKPAAMAGYKEYIENHSEKKVVRSLKFSLAKTPESIKKEIIDTHASYIYFAKYEDYVELFPFPPESIMAGLKKIYENANAQIWSTK